MSSSVETGAPAAPNVLAEVWAVARAEILEMAKSIRAIFLLVTYGLLAGGAGAVILWVNDRTEGKLAEVVEEGAKLGPEERAPAIAALVEQGASPALAEAVVSGVLPPLVFFVLVTSTFVLPVLMLLVGYNRIAEDVSTRYIRYLLQRVHRGTYLAGKLLGHWLVSLAAVVLAHGLLLLLARSTDAFDFERTLAAMPRIWLAMAVFVLAYSAYTMLASALIRIPFLALLAGAMALFALKAGTWILGLIWAPLGDAWLGAWDLRLWALDPTAIAVYLGYTALFIGLAWAVLRWRDL